MGQQPDRGVIGRSYLLLTGIAALAMAAVIGGCAASGDLSTPDAEEARKLAGTRCVVAFKKGTPGESKQSFSQRMTVYSVERGADGWKRAELSAQGIRWNFYWNASLNRTFCNSDSFREAGFVFRPARASKPRPRPIRSAPTPPPAEPAVRPVEASVVGSLVAGEFTVPAPAAENLDGVAVIIGNRTYASRVPEVAYAHNDAAAVRRFVAKVLGYRRGNIIDLRDATQAELMSVFGSRASHKGRLYQFVRPGESDVVVFYSGHGVPGREDRRGYLLPVDANPDTPEINGYPVDLLYENLAKIEARSVTVLLDACFSGESPEGMLIGQEASPVHVTPKVPAVAQGLTVVTAAQGTQLASWDREAGHGLFTAHVLRALYGRADAAPFGNGNGAVTLAEVKAYLDRDMTYAARRRFNRPQQATVLGDEQKVLVAYAPGRLPRPSTVGPGPTRVRPAVGAYPERHVPGSFFKDCADCPEMVVVPPGSFLMGSPEWEAYRKGNEGPQHRVTIVRPLAVGRYEVTRGQFAEFVRDTGYDAGNRCRVWEKKWQWKDGSNWRSPGFPQTDDHPVVCVNWQAAKAYAAWLSRKTGHRYRLLTEAEWEYAARAGTTASRHWGDDPVVACRFANVRDQASKRANDFKSGHAECDDGHTKTAPVGSYRANPFGLHDMIGNVWEAVADCYDEQAYGTHGSYPEMVGGWDESCTRRVIRGGGWNSEAPYYRSARRSRIDPTRPVFATGFRVARTL